MLKKIYRQVLRFLVMDLEKAYAVAVLEDVQEALRWNLYEDHPGARHTADFRHGVLAAIDEVQKEIDMLGVESL